MRTKIPVISGKISNTKSYDLVLTGPGVFNTAHALTAYLEQKTPGLILQTGIAGVFPETGFKVGDVAVATREKYIHTGVQSEGMEHFPLPFELIDRHPSTRQGVYLFEKDRVNRCFQKLTVAFKNRSARVARGRFVTVSTITASKASAADLYSAFEPVMEAMEGAAAAHIALLYDIAFVEARSASNWVGERDKSKWDIQQAAGQIPDICAAISGI